MVRMEMEVHGGGAGGRCRVSRRWAWSRVKCRTNRWRWLGHNAGSEDADVRGSVSGRRLVWPEVGGGFGGSMAKEGRGRSRKRRPKQMQWTELMRSIRASFVSQALLHASISLNRKLVVDWVIASDLEDDAAKESPEVHESAWNLLKGAGGVLVPGGFGDVGVQGKILAAKYARENNVPFLGICLGMQISVIEYARSVLKLRDANSTEFDPETKNPCVICMPEGSRTHTGGTMRLGSRRTYFRVSDCISAQLYGKADYIDERHRHRYEINPDMIKELEGAGLVFVGRDETGERMEILELPVHPYFVGVQFHPEFKSMPGQPSALFLGLIAASSGVLGDLLKTSRHSNLKDTSSFDILTQN